MKRRAFFSGLLGAGAATAQQATKATKSPVVYNYYASPRCECGLDLCIEKRWEEDFCDDGFKASCPNEQCRNYGIEMTFKRPRLEVIGVKRK